MLTRKPTKRARKNTAAKISSISDLLKHLASYFNPKEIIWFRGQEDRLWKLSPSLHRHPRDSSQEQYFVKRFRQNAPHVMDYMPNTEWEWYFLMQHHGIPTRLMDWTENPLIALYFAVGENSSTNNTDGCIWSVSPERINSKSNIRHAINGDILCFEVDPILDTYLPSKIGAPDSVVRYPLAAISPRRFSRIKAQRGVFIIWPNDTTPLEEYKEVKACQFIIPKDKKDKIRSELRYLQITKFDVFPELSNISSRLIEDL